MSPPLPTDIVFRNIPIVLTSTRSSPSGYQPMASNANPNDILEMLHCRILQLEDALTATRPTSTTRKEPEITSLQPFTGRKDEASEFILKCDMVFEVQPMTYASTKSKIAFVTNLLNDEAYRWVMPHLLLREDDQPDWVKDWDDFKEEFTKVFGDSNIIETSRQKLKIVRQTGSATSYATEFQRHAAYLHWGDKALRHAFFDGLKEDVKDKLLTPTGDSRDFQSLVNDAIKWDNLLFQRRGCSFHHARVTIRIDTPISKPRPFNYRLQPLNIRPIHYPANNPSSGPEPMEIDAVRPHYSPLTAQEKNATGAARPRGPCYST